MSQLSFSLYCLYSRPLPGRAIGSAVYWEEIGRDQLSSTSRDARRIMRLAHKHTDTDGKIICFDCRKQICRECMVTTPKALLCKACLPTKKFSFGALSFAGIGAGVNPMVKLQCASVGYSLALLAGLSVASPCIG